MLKQRVITALIIAPLFLIGVFATNILGFALFIGGIVTIGAWEWARISGWERQSSRLLYALVTAGCLVLAWYLSPLVVLGVAAVWWLFAFYLILNFPSSTAIWQPVWLRCLAGLLVIVPAWKALVSLRAGVVQVNPEVSTIWLVIYIFLIVWAADIGAYFAGKTFGRRKLAPAVSPGKSVEGAIGGLVAVSVLPFVVSPLMEISPSQTGVLWMMTLSAAIFSIIGDLLESLGKRVVGIKDSSQILPGHGGILDRIDSVTAAAPIFVLLALVTGWIQG
ncbi:phosphatidate cytidylyltransferase [Hahella sp. CCB-MM4]|uniref:phosphatidate cytidylyltransferase n=1 Tax=Hahella sp. (strain CCB-MM4) TaxID=1926491 RepID=UPI000B9C3E64|nr:phosphatidate cytidylyltransferase [Hahella sp. CCB-MM4]OZG70480.1 phosphatidate cytidylyltransferase [Hahella sp. CCB-MM4]